MDSGTGQKNLLCLDKGGDASETICVEDVAFLKDETKGQFKSYRV